LTPNEPAARTSEAALLFPVPEIEPVIGALRLRYDPSSAAGVPAHVTINYPFLAWAHRADGVLETLRQLLSATSPFDFLLTDVRTFPGVAYLAPEPATPFVELITAVSQRFPDSPPYEGRFTGIVPHVTVADLDDPSALEGVVSEIRNVVQPHLPLPCRARTVWLMDILDGSWRTRHVFPLRTD
jgi:2'-5' RNA ligase